MSDLISRQAAIDALEQIRYALWEIDIPSPTVPEYIEHHRDVQNVMKRIDEIRDKMERLPSAQPERKKGKWIDGVLPNDNGGLPVQICDQCNTFFPLAYTGGGHRFCPNCGAKMGGVK